MRRSMPHNAKPTFAGPSRVGADTIAAAIRTPIARILVNPMAGLAEASAHRLIAANSRDEPRRPVPMRR